MGRDAAIARIEALLDRERRALLAGRVGEVEALIAARTALFDSLDRSADPAALGALARRVRENADLARAAADGLRDALRRISEIRAASGPISSYSAAGAPVRIGARPGSYEHKV